MQPGTQDKCAQAKHLHGFLTVLSLLPEFHSLNLSPIYQHVRVVPFRMQYTHIWRLNYYLLAKIKARAKTIVKGEKKK